MLSQSEQEEPQLKIIGAGFGRTGTSTMKKVFESLGFGNCYHMLENVNYKHTELWNMTMQTPQLKRILREGIVLPWLQANTPLRRRCHGCKIFLTVQTWNLVFGAQADSNPV